MKKYLWALIILFPSVIFSQNNDLNILKLYEGIPSDDKQILNIEVNHNRDYIYIIKQENNKYITQSRSGRDEETVMPFIDFKNGYLSIDDPMHACGAYGPIHHEAAMYIDNNKNVYVAVSMAYTGDSFWKLTKFYFYKVSDSKYINITSKVVPEITINTFTKKQYSTSVLQQITPKLAGIIYYKVPRYGTTLTVIFNLDELKMKAEEYITHDPEEIRLVKDIIQNINRTKVELKWDMGKGRFQ